MKADRMNLDDAILFLSNLEPRDRVYFIALLAHDLTAYARDTYVVGSEDVANPRKLRFHNEIQHRIAGKLLSAILEDADSYPDDDFIRSIYEVAKYADFLDELNASLERSSKVVKRRITAT